MLDDKDVRRYNKMYASRRRNEFVLLAFDTESSKIVGVSNFSAKDKGRTRHMGEMGWSVLPDYARKGIATRLVNAILKEAKRRGFKKAEAEAAVENIASVRLAKKCGFKIEGRKKAGLLLDDGRFVDTYIFGKILR